jgi:transcription termination factor Rho
MESLMPRPENNGRLRDAHADAMFPSMLNRAMARKLSIGEALDVNREGEPIETSLDGGQTTKRVWRLRRFVDDVDYCDAKGEQWIWSIGRSRQTSEILASTSSELYQHPDFECLFLR